jgi:hypothetical protein
LDVGGGSRRARCAPRAIVATLVVVSLGITPAASASAEETAASASAEEAAPTPSASENRSVAGIDLLRFGFPGGVGLGFRGYPIPQLALEAGASTFGLATSLEFSIATLPLARGPDRKVQPLVRVGYRRMFVHRASDRVVRSSLPRSVRSLSEKLALHGARLDMLFVAVGFAYRFTRPALLEVSVGHLAQAGSTRAYGGREALQLRAAQFTVADVRLTFLLKRRRR